MSETLQNATKTGALSPVRERAALMVAQDEITDEEIASRCGVHRVTLEKWKRNTDFISRVEEHRWVMAEEIRREGVSILENRVRRLNRRWNALHRVIAERGADPEIQNVPGGKTGLLVKQIKGIGKGDDFQIVEQYAVDTGTLAELRAIEKQAAQELGQWQEKTEVTGDPNKPVIVQILRGVSMDEL